MNVSPPEEWIRQQSLNCFLLAMVDDQIRFQTGGRLLPRPHSLLSPNSRHWAYQLKVETKATTSCFDDQTEINAAGRVWPAGRSLLFKISEQEPDLFALKHFEAQASFVEPCVALPETCQASCIIYLCCNGQSKAFLARVSRIAINNFEIDKGQLDFWKWLKRDISVSLTLNDGVD